MEAMFAIVERDPDRPLVTGVVPYARQKVPYELPANKTRSVFRTNTHKGVGFNELRFEDEAGREEVFLHAQKDMNLEVKNNRAKNVRGNEHTQVLRNFTGFVGGFEAQYACLGRMISTGGTLSFSSGRSSPINLIDPSFFSIGGTFRPHFTNLLNDPEENTAYRPGSMTFNSGAECSMRAAGDFVVGSGESITLSAQETVSLTSGETVRLTAGGSIFSYACGNMVLASDSAMIFRAGNAEIIMSPNGDISTKGKLIKLLGDKICLN